MYIAAYIYNAELFYRKNNIQNSQKITFDLPLSLYQFGGLCEIFLLFTLGS